MDLGKEYKTRAIRTRDHMSRALDIVAKLWNRTKQVKGRLNQEISQRVKRLKMIIPQPRRRKMNQPRARSDSHVYACTRDTRKQVVIA